MMTLIQDYGADLLRAIGLHTIYVLISVVIGFAAGLVFGILLSRIPRWLSGIIIPILSIFQTIPGLVFIGVLFIWWGNIYPTVIVALSVYAMFPVLKNTYTGILEVESQYIEAAKGCGMSSFQALVKVELPLAMPVIIAGVRMAAIYTVSWAVLAAMIGKGGRSPAVCEAIRRNQAVYLCALGGAGALAAQAVRSVEVIAFEDLGCESVKRLVVEDFPLVVGIDCAGGSLFR